MLKLIGLGINVDFTISGLNAAKASDVVFIEKYTSPVDRDIVEKVKSFGLDVEVVDRSFVESSNIIDMASKKDVSLLIVGDPLSATTHYALIKECFNRGIEYKVFHNSSIFTAAAETGLSLYKFGRTVTIAYWRDNYKPTSPIQFIEQNMSLGLHTLALLDVDESMGGPMDAKLGLELIKKMEEKEGINVVRQAFVLSRVGFDDQKITFGEVDDLLSADLGKPLFSIIIPGHMNDVEKEFASMFVLR